MENLRGLEKSVAEFCKTNPMPEISPKKRTFYYPASSYKQGTFDFAPDTSPSLPSIFGRIGLYGELLTQAVFGGRLHHNHKYTKNHSGQENFEYEFCQPDIVTRNGDVIEVKSVRSAGDLQFKDRQMEKYFWLLLSNKKVRNYVLAVVRHNLKHAQKKLENLSQEEQLKLLSQSTIYAALIPFSVSYPIFDSPNCLRIGKGISYRHNKPESDFEDMTRLRSPLVNELFFDPQQFLQRVFLHPEDYLISRGQVSGLRVRGEDCSFPVKPFPVLEIRDRDIEKWLVEFRKKYEARAEEAKSRVAEQKAAVVRDFFAGLAPQDETQEELF